MGTRLQERGNTPGLYVLRNYHNRDTAIEKIQLQMRECDIPGLAFDVKITEQDEDYPCLFIRYAFDRLPADCRFGPASRSIRETLQGAGLLCQDDNGTDLVCDDYRLRIGAVHSSMLASRG